MCDLDIHIALKDRESGKFIEYSSIGTDGQLFTIEHVKAVLEEFKSRNFARNYRMYTDNDYEGLKT